MSSLLRVGEVHSLDALRALPSVPSPDRSAGFGVFYVRGAVKFYTWHADETGSDDGDNILRPTDRPSGAGRWSKASMGGSSFPAPLADFPVSGITQAAGRLTGWNGTNGYAWQVDTSQAFFTAPVYNAAAKNGLPGAVFTGAGAEKTIMLLNTSSFQASATPWTFGIVVSNDRDEATPTTTRGYYLSFQGTGTSGADTDTKVIFAEIANDTIMKSMGYWDSVADVDDGGTGWHYAKEDNYAGGKNRVDVRKGWQVLVCSVNPGVANGSFWMRDGVVIGRFTVSTTKKATNRVTLGAEYNADATDQTYTRGTMSDHAIWNQTLSEAQAAAWCAEKQAKFAVTAWPPAATLPTWASVWYDASASSYFVREHDRAITSAGNRGALGTGVHAASQGVAGDKPFLQPCADGVSQHSGMVFLTLDNLAAHSVAALIDGTDDFTIAVVSRAINTTNSDGRLVRAVNSGGGSALIALENPFADPQSEPVLATRHDGTNNVTLAGPSGDQQVHFWVIERTGGDLRIGRDGLYRSVTATQATIAIDQLFVGGGQTNQEIFSWALLGGANATAQQLSDEHARAVAYWGCRAQPATQEPWQYGATFWAQPNQANSYHEDGSAPGTIDRLNNRGTANVNLTQATNANNPVLVGAGTPQVYLDFVPDQDMVGTAIAAIIAAGGWHAWAVVWVDAVNTSSANFDANDMIVGDNSSFWALALRDLGAGAFQVQSGQWDGARQTAVQAITLGAWHVVHGWYDGTNIRVAVDGVEGTPDTSGVLTTLTGTAALGGASASTTRQFDGRLRGLAVFNTNISAGGQTAMDAWGAALAAL